MADSATRRFSDPEEHAAAIRAGVVRMLVTAPGAFRSELTRIDLDRLWMQRGRESLPYVSRSALHRGRSVVFFLAGADEAPILHSGMDLPPSKIVLHADGAEYYRRTHGECAWAAMSLPAEDLAAAGRAIAGRDLTAPPANRVIQPPAHLMLRLMRLHEAAAHLAATVPDILAHPEVARAVEQELVRAMVACLTDGAAVRAPVPRDWRIPVMRRFERVLEANPDRPLYLPEVCRAVGVADRTLRNRCAEQLGMSPHRYLWLRRMHQARRALVQADPAKATVTEVAVDSGFGELGRFAVAYRRLFGEKPSKTLRRAPEVAKPVPERAPWDRFPVLP